VGFGPWGFKSLRPHCRTERAAARYDPFPLGAVAQLAKAPVSKTGDSRFESWLPRSILWLWRLESRFRCGIAPSSSETCPEVSTFAH
jgi:hypothetical protein